MSISTSKIKSEELENITCSVIILDAVVQGEVYNLINFIIKLNDDYTTGFVRSAEISIPETADEGEPFTDIQMVVYTYEGD